MDTIRARVLFAALAAFAATFVARAAVAGPSKNTQITLNVTDETGNPAPISTQVQILDSTGTVGTCPVRKPGIATCNTTGLTAPFLINGMATVWANAIYGEASALSGHFNADRITTAALDQIAHSWGTTVGAWWTPGTPPNLPNQAVLNSNNFQLDRALLSVSLDYKFSSSKSPLAFNVYSLNYNISKSGYGKFEQGVGITGVGTSVQNFQIGLSGGRTYSATFTAVPSVLGTAGKWSVTSGSGTTLQTGYEMNPIDPNTPAVIQGIQNFNTSYMAMRRHEGSKDDWINELPFLASNFNHNGINATLEADILATRGRQETLNSLAVGSIAFLQKDTPAPNQYVVGVDILRTAKNHGVPCTSLCCTYFVCSPGSSNGYGCLKYGNQRIAGFELNSTLKEEFNSTGSTLTNFLSAKGRALSGTVQGFTISDSLSTFYHNTTDPFDRTVTETTQPVHNGPTQTFDVDIYGLMTAYTPPPPNGITYQVQVTPTTGNPQSWTIYSRPFTTEPVPVSVSSTDASLWESKAQKIAIGPSTSRVRNALSVKATQCNATATMPLKTIPPKLSPNSNSVTISKLASGMDGATVEIVDKSLGGPSARAEITVGPGCGNK